MEKMLLKKYSNKKRNRLIAAIVIDLIGFIPSLIPIIGSGFDLIWAPISFVLILILFPNRKFLAVVGGLEEIMPSYIDIVPTACIAWYYEYQKNSEKSLIAFVRKEVGDEQIVRDILRGYSINSEKQELNQK